MPEDVGRLLEIAGEAEGASRWSEAEYEKYVARPREGFFHRYLVVAAAEERVVGFAAGSFLEGDDAALMENIAVAGGARRRGVARALCAEVAGWARSEGALGLNLEVRESNAAARALYAGLGFVEQGRRPRYYSDPEEDGLLMGLRFQEARVAIAL